MAAIARYARLVFSRSPSPPRQPTNSKFHVLDTAQKVEEERFEWYKPVQFYPVRIGEVFNSRYQVVGKLGYGAHSTAWLCRDLVYVTISSALKHLADW
jgi:hypothetical protein